MPRQQVFLSYAREDEKIALRLRADLVGAGVDVWIDKHDLAPGRDWRESIRGAIEQSAYVIVLLSSHSVGKRGFVQSEIRYALQVLEEHPPSKVYLVPVRVDDCEPQHRRIRELHWIDLFPSYAVAVNHLATLLTSSRRRSRQGKVVASSLALPITSVGSMSIDVVRGPFGSYERLAGTAIYFAAAASLFSTVRVVSVIGTDIDLGPLKPLEERSVDFGGVTAANGKTFRWTGEYSTDLYNRTTLECELNTFAHFDPVIPTSLSDSPIVHLGNVHPILQMRALHQMNGRQCSVLDTMNFWITQERDSLIQAMKLVDGLFINDDELQTMTGVSESHVAAERVLEMGGLRFLIVKRGFAGAALFTHSGVFTIPAFPRVNVKDPTGAGDSFAGGVLGYLAARAHFDENDLREATVYGNVAASFVLEDLGYDNLLRINRRDFDKRLAEYKRAISSGTR